MVKRHIPDNDLPEQTEDVAGESEHTNVAWGEVFRAQRILDGLEKYGATHSIELEQADLDTLKSALRLYIAANEQAK